MGWLGTRLRRKAAAISARTGIDILEFRDRDSLSAQMRAHGLPVPEDDTWPQLVDELLSKHVEPTVIEPTFILDYPVELSPFAKRHRDSEGLVERFEAYAAGMEIATSSAKRVIILNLICRIESSDR